MNAIAERREHNYYTVGTYNEVERLFKEEGLKAKEIAERLGMVKRTVNNILRSRGIRQRNWSPTKPAIKPEDIQGLIRAYNGGKSVSELAIMYSCTTGTIRDYLRRNNVKTNKYAPPMSDKKKSDICRYYRLGWPYEKIAEAVGVKIGTVQNYISKQGLANRNASRQNKELLMAPLRLDGTPDIRKIEKVEEPKEEKPVEIESPIFTDYHTGFRITKTVRIDANCLTYELLGDHVSITSNSSNENKTFNREYFLSVAHEMAAIADMMEKGEV